MSAQPDRAPLSRERALLAAVALADASGFASVTMRKVAAELGVEAMSLYHHVSGKGDIEDGMIDAVFAEVELPSEHDDWTDAMARRAHSLRNALLRHPWAIGLMDSRRSPGVATLRHHDAVIGCCRAAGFSVRMAAHAFALMDSYIYGFVLQEVNLPFDESSDLTEVIDEILPEAAMSECPHLAEMATLHVLRPGYRFGDEFDFGLDLILDRLAAQLNE